MQWYHSSALHTLQEFQQQQNCTPQKSCPNLASICILKRQLYLQLNTALTDLQGEKKCISYKQIYAKTNLESKENELKRPQNYIHCLQSSFTEVSAGAPASLAVSSNQLFPLFKSSILSFISTWFISSILSSSFSSFFFSSPSTQPRRGRQPPKHAVRIDF